MRRNSTGEVNRASITSRLSSCSSGNSTKCSSKNMYPVTPTVQNGAHRAHRAQRGHREANLLGQLPPCRCFWRFTAPEASTGQVPPRAIRQAYQQQFGTDIEGDDNALVPRACQSPPDTGQRETNAEAVRQANSRNDKSGARRGQRSCRAIRTASGT